jgi:hypothetical protein
MQFRHRSIGVSRVRRVDSDLREPTKTRKKWERVGEPDDELAREKRIPERAYYHLSFAALPHIADAARQLTDPLRRATGS